MNDFKQALKCLDLIMFDDNTNSLYFYKNIEVVFLHCKFNNLKKINQWFKAKKLPITIEETKFTSFHKSFFKDEIPLKLPVLIIENNDIEIKYLIKFLVVMMDEYISWINHVRTVQNETAKYVGLL